MSGKTVIIQGIRGIPGRHGGFETFAQRLAQYLCELDYNVIVYCQEQYPGMKHQSKWHGITRIHIPIRSRGPLGTILFDLYSIIDSLRYKGVVLTLGYNTALFNLLYRITGRKNVINMDGIEWRRDKWGWLAKAWFYFNEKIGCLIGTRLIADHPEIARHLSRTVSEKKICTIAYGADMIDVPYIPEIRKLGLEDGGYLLVIARPEPENSILEIVRAYSQRPRGKKLVVLGDYDKTNNYHAKVLQAASSDVIFPGALYDKKIVSALRYHCYVYLHGHTVGGTNPSLVEALAAGCAVIAHNNPFNRWVAGEASVYFHDEAQLASILEELLSDSDRLRIMSGHARTRFDEEFTWDRILKAYERLLEQYA